MALPPPWHFAGHDGIVRAILVDAFTDEPFTGNPAAVAVMERWPSERTMATVAAEINYSETAFVVARADGDHDLRWFTPTVEVDLCGHATLAAAAVLGGAARFHTRSGLLECVGSPGGWVSTALPADPPEATALPSGLALSGVRWFGRGRFDAVAVLGDAGAVRAMVPDLISLARLGTRGVIVTAPGDEPGVDFVSRFFAPNAGVPEDPVTGSAHCTLAEWWGERLGRRELVGRQVSRRGGTVHMARRGATVTVSGQTVTVGQVELYV